VEFAPSNTSLYSPASASVAIEVTPSTTAISAIYSYSIVNASGGTGYDANGNILSYTDSVTGAWSSLGYDGVNRLIAGTQAPVPINGVAQSPQSFCWSYDSFGNRTAQLVQSAACSSPAPTVTYNTSNQVTWVQTTAPAGFTYDAAGNVFQDNLNNYLYDAEGRICAVQNRVSLSATGYIYDAEGARVAKGTLTQFTCDTTLNPQTGMPNNGFSPTSAYVLGPSGEQLTETDGSGNWKHTNVYAAGALIATYDNATNNTVFALNDWLGTKRVEMGANGCATAYTSLAFGDELTPGPVPGYTQCADDATEHHFTGKERDTESGNDYFGARYYASSMGRFMSPDEPFADFDPDNPQSWNLYGYVRNNPMTNTDPDGNDCVTQTRNSSTTETVTVNSGTCSGNVGDGQSQTYVNGTVTGVAAGADGHSIDIGFNSYDGQSSGVQNAGGAPMPDNPGIAYGWGNNAQGYQTLGTTSATVSPIAGAVMAGVGIFMPGIFAADAAPIALGIVGAADDTIAIGKVADLNKGLGPGEKTLDLPNQGNPKDNWAQNSSRLREAMSNGKPIHDVSAGNPGSNTGFLRAERNLLQSHGWTLKGEYWVPPGR
jgi:RHS repeat-associated protein